MSAANSTEDGSGTIVPVMNNRMSSITGGNNHSVVELTVAPVGKECDHELSSTYSETWPLPSNKFDGHLRGDGVGPGSPVIT